MSMSQALTIKSNNPPKPIILTETAAAKVRELLEAEGDASLALRIGVRPGGCSGFSYEMFFDTETEPDDLIELFGGVKVVVDPESAERLRRVHARLQGRAHRRRVRRQQPQRHQELRLRQLLLLISFRSEMTTGVVSRQADRGPSPFSGVGGPRRRPRADKRVLRHSFL